MIEDRLYSEIVKYYMDQFDDDHAYQLLYNAFGDTPYVQHEFWGTRRGFKPDPILGILEFIIDGVPNQVQTYECWNQNPVP